jgi:hypothetical protein
MGFGISNVVYIQKKKSYNIASIIPLHILVLFKP